MFLLKNLFWIIFYQKKLQTADLSSFIINEVMQQLLIYLINLHMITE